MKPRGKTVKGLNAGLNSPTIAALMNCSVTTAKRYLKRMKVSRKDLTLDDLGNLIHYFREEKKYKAMRKALLKEGIKLD